MTERAVSGEVLRRSVRLVGPPALGLGPHHQRRPARDGLRAATAAASAQRPGVRVHDDVADVACVAGRALDQLAIEDQPAANARRYDHAKDVVTATPGAAPVLGGDEADGVVMHPDGYAAEPLGQPAAQREPAPPGDIQW